MTHTFYDVKLRQKTEAEVTEKVVYTRDNGQKRYAFRGKTADGRTLMQFVGQATFDAADVPTVQG